MKRNTDASGEEAKRLASKIVHMHYCYGASAEVASYFAPQFTWVGAGEKQYIAGREEAEEMFRKFQWAIPECNIWDEQYDVIEPVPGVFVVSGRMWIATSANVEMYLKVHQRLTLVFQESEEGLRCAHIHCSNPFQEMGEEELFPEKIGRQSYQYIQERLAQLEEQALQQKRQMEVVLSSIAGGLKISYDDENYAFAYVSKEAAGLFGYTVDEFMEVTGGTAVGAVYPPDRERALAESAAAFQDGGLAYSTRYRIRCKDGSLKWIIDSGKKAQDAEGNWKINSLYLDVTKDEEDARRLQEQSQLLQSIYDTVPCGIIRFVRRRNGVYSLISLNRATRILLGYDAFSQSIPDWSSGVMGNVLKEDQEMLRASYHLLHQVGDRQDREYRVRWEDGSLHWLSGTNMVVDRTAEGEVVIQRTLIDITERKELQQQLEQEQEMYRVAMESSSDTMFEYLIDADTYISYEPQPGKGVIRREINNYSRQLLNKDFICPEDAPVVMDNICKGRAEMFEVRVVTPHTAPGDYRWHSVSSRLIMKNGKPSRVVGTLRNIHDIKETLSENSERLHMSQSALQAISGVYVSIFYVNLTKDEYYGVRLPQLINQLAFPRIGRFTKDLCESLFPKIIEKDRDKVAHICDREWLLNNISKSAGCIEVEFRQEASKGKEQPNSYIWLRLEIHPVSMEGAENRTAIITIRNISGEKKLELERLEEEKAAKQALEEAYAGARRANVAKSEFLSRMSHDIRTPMNAILGMTAIAENRLEDAGKTKECLSKIRVAANHLLGLINEVLDMSKIESGNIGLSEREFVLSDTLNTVEQIIRPDAESRGQHFEVCARLGRDVLVGDSMRIQQILINLLSNAVKYTAEGGHISLSAEEKISNHSGVGCYEFVVEDDGIGMSPEFQEKMFTPFERAEDERVSDVQGTGLGLSIANNLVQMMNGSIQFQSHLNQGTRFVVTIYLKLAQKEPTPQFDNGNGSAPKHSFAPGTCILLVEDNDINREIGRELLEMSGLETVCAVNGKQAVELFASNPPGTYSVILMDIQMPVMNGYQATQAIRQLAENGRRPDAADIPIIALTANAFADDVYRAHQAGMNEHATKPLDLDQLLGILQRWLENVR